MRKIFAAIVIFLVTAFSLSAQTMKVALLETLNGDNSVQVKGIEMNMVRGELRKAISNQNGFQAFTRTDIDQLMKEHGFQNSGMVSDSQRKRLGEMSEADYICVSTLTKSNTDFYLEAYLIDIETGEISNSATQYGRLDGGTYANLFQICQDLSQELVGYVGGLGSGSNSNAKPSRNHDYTETACGLNMRMIYVEGGTFTMGCTSEQEGDCFDNESPSRRTMVNSFYIGMFEVTQSQWEKVMGTTVYQQKNMVHPDWQLPGAGSSYPMYYVSWSEAEEFCQRLSQQTGKTYRLPTEAEWEYAARGGKKAEDTKYSGSSDINKVAWYSGNNNGSIHPCGTKQANALGIYDMSGNVWEWCEDWYGIYIYTDIDNPKGASAGEYRVVRGGSWTHYASYCRVSCHDRSKPDNRDHYGGFRVVMVP